jgi:tetratricopeptide (TPR) repeat protein
LDQLEEHANASIGMGPCLFAACRYQEALEIGDEISAHSFDRLGPHNRVRLLTMRGVANFGLGEYKSAWQQTTAAFALDDETPCTHENPFGGGDPAIVARRYAIQSGLPLGYVDECLPIVREALEIAHKRNHAFTVAWALLNAAHIYRETGRFADALSNGSEAIALCERYGFVARMGTVLLYIGAAYCRLGDTERGLGDIRRGLDIWRSTSNQFHMSYHLSDFADCLLRAKKYDEADRALREAEQIIAETDERSHVGEVLRLRGLLQILSGDVGDGAAKLWQAVKWARSRDARLFELRALRDLTLSDISQDEKKKAATALHQLLSWFPHGLEIPDLHEARDALQPVKPT